MEIVITDKKTVECESVSLDVFKKYGNVTSYDLTDYSLVAERVRDADAVLCNKTVLNRETLKNADKLKYIGLFATGYNNIDLEYTRERGIVVSNAAGYSTNAVAQHVFALILHFYNSVSQYGESVSRGDWKSSAMFSYFDIPLYELAGKTLGIIGYGAIGKKTAEIARAFGMCVIVHTRTKNCPSTEYVEFDELLQRSDIISVHCPLSGETEKLINERAFSKMKKSAVLINTARGAIIDEKALYNALSEHRIAGAGIDVLETEPMKKDSPLTELTNIIITPHVAWAGVETRNRLIGIVEDNLKGFLISAPRNIVN